ncbi:MAG: arginase, partial [Candidatus Eremiobacteraeota bacterium]|nr:arginase [Candidatus Eremiobacteraeota bacterium]
MVALPPSRGSGQTIDIIGVPMEWGAGRAGVRLGPSALRSATLAQNLTALGYSVRDRGDVDVVVVDDEPDDSSPRPHHVDAIRRACAQLADVVQGSLNDSAFPVVIGGDHSLAIGVLAGVARTKGPQGVIWIDAHADMNTPRTSPSGNVHGMAMAIALGEVPDLFPPPDFPAPSVDASRCVFVGLRDVDPGERRLIRERGIVCLTMSDIDRHGMAAVMDRAIAVAGSGPGSAHISLDIDSLDPQTAPGTGTPVRG